MSVGVSESLSRTLHHLWNRAVMEGRATFQECGEVPSPWLNLKSVFCSVAQHLLENKGPEGERGQTVGPAVLSLRIYSSTIF